MPEMLEVEVYRRAAAASVGRRILAVDAPDAWFLKGGIDAATVKDALVGRSFVADRRRGKLLLLDTSNNGPTLGLRFGMTGVLELDGIDAIGGLEYASHRKNPAWERFVVHFEGGGALRLRDPRRLGGVELDPVENRLGPDAGDVTLKELKEILAGSNAPLKARLMDQARLAGLGNLLTDETLWRSGFDPARAAGSLTDENVAQLRRSIRTTLRVLGRRGGSHMGDLQQSRQRGGCCPTDGAVLLRRTIGGRTTYSCPHHQL
ncbi:MAG: DNA-formamidopyrimidine glycosylase family protein [Acidimicrobiales bacterium]